MNSSKYYFSNKLQLYIPLEPLKIDDQVISTAYKIGIENLHWNELGSIDYINQINAKKLTTALGGFMLTARQYWQLYFEAVESQNTALLKSLESEDTEWLNTVYIKNEQKEVFMVEDPQFEKVNNLWQVKGTKVPISISPLRPGWFDPINNIDLETGFPLKVNKLKTKGGKNDSWKYWAVEQVNSWVGSVRSYVISSYTPAMDNDLPITANVASNTVRVCLKQLPESPIDQKVLNQANQVIEKYDSTLARTPGLQNRKEHTVFYTKRSEQALGFIEKHGAVLTKLNSLRAKQICEKMIDILGILRIMSVTNENTKLEEQVLNITENLFNVPQQLTSKQVADFVKKALPKAKKAFKEKKKVVFVMGHKNPDADTAISCLLEAYRRQLLDSKAVYIPLIQANEIPPEIDFLYGIEISKNILKHNDPFYEKVKNSGIAKWVLTDHNVSPIQRYVEAITDHHLLAENAKRIPVPLTWEMLGSSTAMVWLKLQGMGISLDKSLSKMVFGATLLDTENKDQYKMTYRDKLIMDLLHKQSGVKNVDTFYYDAMGNMLKEESPRILFERDYKEDWFLMGFAVAKVKNMFSGTGKVREPATLQGLVELAQKNNKAKNFAVTLVKVVDYEDDNQKVRRERMYTIFNSLASPEFKEFFVEYLQRIIKHRFGSNANLKIVRGENYVDYYGTGDQLSRKVTAPFLEKVVEPFNRYYKCSANNLWFSRTLLTHSTAVQQAAKKLGIKYGLDKNRVVNIDYIEARKLANELGAQMPSLPEWRQMERQSLRDNDQQMQQNCQQLDICEALDSMLITENSVKQYLINHPKEICIKKGKTEYSGEKEPVAIPEAQPALALAEDFSEQTGLPTKIYPADMQTKLNNPIRFWSPRDSISRATITSINLNKNKAVDLRMGVEESFMKLSLRLVKKELPPPNLEIYENNEGVFIREK